MKATLFILVLTVLLQNASAQEKGIKVQYDDASYSWYGFEELRSISFTTDTLPQYYDYLIKIKSKDSVLASYSTRVFDSLCVEIDTNQAEVLALYFSPLGYRIPYLISEIDSVVFVRRHPLPTSADTNFKVTILPFTYGFDKEGNFRKSVWYKDRVFSSEPIRYFDFDDNLEVVVDSTLHYEENSQLASFGKFWPLFMRIDKEGKRLLSVVSNKHTQSIGWIVEFSTDTLSFQILDSGEYNSSAVYMPNDSDFVYYTYGSYSNTNRNPADAGYYLYNRMSGSRTFLLHHISDIGPVEMVNGFDISPDGKKLLIPSVGYERQPIVFEYNIETHVADTLPISFNTSFNRWALWLRYNKDASKILYSNYPLFSFSEGSAANDSSEVGIIDHLTFNKKILDTAPLYTVPWICVFPEWAFDETKIVYGAAIVTESGTAGVYQVCILKTLE
ncbi:MAG TPA: hypothetical protein VIX80_02905 [Candidatus Kapabacteria bacterium]